MNPCKKCLVSVRCEQREHQQCKPFKRYNLLITIPWCLVTIGVCQALSWGILFYITTPEGFDLIIKPFLAAVGITTSILMTVMILMGFRVHKP